jgi:serine/threonine protein kinase
MTTATLSHPNTVRIYDHGATEDGLWYYAMELLEGRDLSTIVREAGPMQPARAVHLVRQAARALAEAHAVGIVHRDIKPENVFVATLGGEKDFVKVLDFGIARAGRVRDARLTTTGWVAGTPAYVSPEAARGESADAPADVYGLGMVLYWSEDPRDRFVDAGALAAALDDVAAMLPWLPDRSELSSLHDR